MMNNNHENKEITSTEEVVNYINRGTKWDKSGQLERTLFFSFEETKKGPLPAYWIKTFSSLTNENPDNFKRNLNQEIENNASSEDEITLFQKGFGIKIENSSDTLKNTVRSILSSLGTKIGLEFVEATDNEKSNLHFLAFSSLPEKEDKSIRAYTYSLSENNDSHAIIMIRTDAEADEETISHEVGHALGLDHYAPKYENVLSIMGENVTNNLKTFTEIDMQALKKSYGPDTAHVDNKTVE